MTSIEIQKFGEIQYLKGRLDELHKALPNVTSMEKSRRLDQRVEKYFNKLREVDEVAYHLYQVELRNRLRAKEKSKEEMKDLLEEIINSENLQDIELKDRILNKINTY
jgi:division protein CdvB (Snf7/Vps24/ESCRT-III family)